MPTDKNLDQFPLPSQSDDSSSSDSPPITDPIAPDISASPKPKSAPTPDPDQSFPESEISTEPEPATDTGVDIPPQKPKTEPDVTPPPQPELKPASAPKSTSKTLFTIILLLLIIAGVSTAVFLYTQNNELKDLVSNLDSNIQQQEIADRASLPPTEEDESSTVTTANTEFTIPTKASTPIVISTPLSSPLTQTFAIFTPLFELATSKYPDAQLLLISASNLQQNTPTIKYYFRQEPDKVKYFYILHDPETGLSLFDQQVWVSPDNNIPSLNDRAKSDQLGADLDTILNLTNSLCSENHSNCDQATSIKAQLIDSNVTLWQITYQLPDSSSPLVYQINSQTQNVIFRSDN